MLKPLLATVPLLFLPLPVKAELAPFNQVDLVCYMQTADGQVVNLTRFCGRTPPPVAAPAPVATSGTPVAPLSPYTNLGNLDIYGRGRDAPPCFGLDDEGRPCPTSDPASR